MARRVTEIKGIAFDLPVYYKPERLMGTGAYGSVCLATDTRTGVQVAIKKCGSLFENLTDTKRILREIALLKYLKHPNIVNIIDVIEPREIEVKFKEIYIVLEMMQTDMRQIIASKQALSIEHIKYFMYQLLKGVLYMHSAGVIHRDLKPSNLLLNSDCDLRICDFGLARLTHNVQMKTEKPQADSDYSASMTMYVATRWYRAPEIILGLKKYTTAADIWSVGCILGELMVGKPLFPGKNYIDQLQLIFKVVGSPSSSDVHEYANAKAISWLQTQPKHPSQLEKIFAGADHDAKDLLEKLLVLNPAKRISVDEAIKHPFFESCRETETEITYKGKPINLPFEKMTQTNEIISEYLLRQIEHFHHIDRPEIRPDLPKEDDSE